MTLAELRWTARIGPDIALRVAVLAFASALVGLGCAGSSSVTTACPPASLFAEGSRLVDLSHAYDEQTIFWPTEEGFKLEKEFDGITPGGFYYAANHFSMPEHGGTHIDAPIHFAEGKPTVDRIPLQRLMGPSVVVDVTEACARDRDYRVTVADLEAWERKHRAIPKGAIVLLFTGFSRFWPDREKYMGTAARGQEAVKKLHFPGLHPDAAVWLADTRAIRAVGLDTPSIDHGPTTTFDTHRALFAREVPAFENLTNLDQLPATGATVVALPMKIRGGSGGPLRAMAIVPSAR
ncbi:MAG TPA: cyclase family protein [Labilithrix sp.]|nr:cyclase family protein [Labilithrix sp.]